jgi:Flp pilus assembly protein TadD
MKRHLTHLLVLLAILTGPATGYSQQDRTARILQRADSLFAHHRYAAADSLVTRILQKQAANKDALLRKARLQIQQWRLASALKTLDKTPAGPDARYLRGRIALLQKQYDVALARARELQRLAPSKAEGFLLEADVHFWQEKPDLAEAPLMRALALDPDNADARFMYGYAIWRRVDASQLPVMAEQWNRALAIDPLHYVTHWHFGNGHTHLTFADYAQPTDSIVRVRLRGVDSLVAQERIADALAATRSLEREYPEALLPSLARGSIFYMAYDMPRAERLDSAQAIFLALLARKPNYGPAHNGLAAVIKQRQLEFVANYDSLESAIAAEPLPADSAFAKVFKDLSYYPGDRVERMARQQLGPALAYVPMLARLGYTYTVPPLHRDLDEALGRNYFRTSTTFDNRQWMDIRGAGGNHAAAGIEYVERGSHQERVVLLHEYVHQWHGAVLTDRENRRIRQLYHDAMANARTLDYYASNNESEFFAQSYEAYLSPVKVHPLNHKSMNTRADLFSRDPALFAFLDTMITRNRAFLAGDKEAMRSNWAHVYVTLARQARGRSTTDSAAGSRAIAFADTALTYDSLYVPAMLEAAQVATAQRRWSDAEMWLARAERTDTSHAPTLSVRADLVAARARAEADSLPVRQMIDLYRRALLIERDLAERARLNTTLRELYRDHGMFPDAIALAEEQAAAPAPSTYLRDQRDEALVFMAGVRARAGHARAQIPFFTEMLRRKPQQFGFRASAAATLLDAGMAAEALSVLDEGARILRAGGQPRADYIVLRAAALTNLGRFADADSAIALLTPSQRESLAIAQRLRLVRARASQQKLDSVEVWLPPDSVVRSRLDRADVLAVRAFMAAQRGGHMIASRLYGEALTLNPFDVHARLGLANALVRLRRVEEARRVVEGAERLPMKLGEEWYRELKSLGLN